MLDEVLYLTPEDTEGPVFSERAVPDIPRSKPEILIPGIREDGSLFPIEKIEAHVKGVHHLALSVFIFDGDDLLIQQRAKDKYHCGGMWANTCCTHPHMGEDIQTAVARRLDEELGITIAAQEKRIVEYSADVGNGLWERERVHMFRAEADKNTLRYNLNPEEVAAIRWVSRADLVEEINTYPERFTPWFRIYVSRFPELDF
ncbi:MAG: isopentenyl-diphosphate Delta-isomerase [Pseudomonadota bacterium]